MQPPLKNLGAMPVPVPVTAINDPTGTRSSPLRGADAEARPDAEAAEVLERLQDIGEIAYGGIEMLAVESPAF